jgi:hypothetical protein
MQQMGLGKKRVAVRTRKGMIVLLRIDLLAARYCCP